MGLIKAGLHSGVVLILSGRNSGIFLYVVPDTRGVLIKNFLISPLNHILWVLIRSTSLKNKIKKKKKKQ